MQYKTQEEPQDLASHQSAFLAFVKAVNKEMGPTWDALDKSLSDVVEEMKGQMREIDGFKARLIFLKAKAKHYLANACVLKKPAKSPDLTDLDRKAMLRALTTNEEGLVEVLEDTLELINNRVSMGQTILKDETKQRGTG